MSILDEEERKILILEYETLHKENWERGQNVWLVNSILITGSLIVSFQSGITELPTPFVSLILVIIASMIHATSDKVTAVTYRRMEGIRETLRMIGPTRMYYTEIGSEWWYSIRLNLPYGLYLILACIYLFLVVHDHYIVIIALFLGFILILVRELSRLVKIWLKQAKRNN